MKNKKKIILGSIIGIFIGLILGTTYAIFSYSKVGDNQQLITGDIYMHYKESNELTISNALPSNTYDPTKYFEFTIEGKNTNTKYNIVYDINLNYGDNIDNKIRVQDRFLKFRLVEVLNNEEQELLTDKTYLSIDNKRIYVGTINKNQTTEITKTYRLYMWIDKSVVIGNTDYADYSITDWNNVYGSVKVSVTGDFSEKTIQTEPYLVLKNLNGIQAWKNIRASITSIEFHDDGIVPESPVATIDVTDTTSAGEVTLYTVDDGLGNNTYKAIVVADDVIYAPENSASMFRQITNLVTFNSKNFKVDNAIDIGSLFMNCQKLININSLSTWNTTNVTNMSSVFAKCSSLSNIDSISNWNVSNVTILQSMFNGCTNLTDVSALANWDVSNVKYVAGIFNNCSNLININGLAYWNVTNVSSMQNLFCGCTNLIDISPLSNWATKTGKVENMSQMFAMDANKTGNPVIDFSPLANWNVSSVINTSSMFQNVNILSYQAFANWDVSKVQNFSHMFNQTPKSTVTTLSGLENWNVSSATNMAGMFYENIRLTDASAINNWNINSDIDFTEMFWNTPVHPTFSKVAGTWNSNGTFTPNA